MDVTRLADPHGDIGLRGVAGGRIDARLALAAIVAIAIVIRVLPLTYSHFWDETVFLQHARILVDGRTNYDEFFHRPPLLPFLYAAGMMVRDSIYSANVVQGLVSGLAVAFAYLYVRRRFDAGAALCVALLLAFTPYVVERSHELLTDAPAITLMLASMWLFDRRGAGWAIASGVALGLAIETRYTSIFLALYLVIDALLPPRKLRELCLAGAATLIVLAPYLLWNESRFGAPLYPLQLASRIVHEWTAPVPVSFYWNALGQIVPASVWCLFALGAAFVARAWWADARRERRADNAGRARAEGVRCAVLLAWGAAFLAYMATIPHKEVRYLLPLAIPVFVLAAVGLSRTWGALAARPPWVRLAAPALAAIIAVHDFAPALAPLWRAPVDATLTSEVEIAEYLRSRSGPADTIYAAHNFPVFAFYSGRNTVSLLPIQYDFETEWRDTMRAPGYLVYTHPESIGEIHAVDPALKPDRDFLERHAEFTVDRVFPTVTIYRYTPAPAAAAAH